MRQRYEASEGRLGYIRKMEYKDRLLQHEFGGDDQIVKKLREVISQQVYDNEIYTDKNSMPGLLRFLS